MNRRELTACAARAWGRAGTAVAGSGALVYGTLLGGVRRDASVSVGGNDEGGYAQSAPVRLRVVSGLPGWAYPRGGVCIGDTFLTGPAPAASVLRHEARHVLQWRTLGLALPFLYWAAGSNPYTNRFEIEAGLEEGGYGSGSRHLSE